MTALIRYEAARLALAEAKSVDDVMNIRDKAEAMRAYARIRNDPQLEIDAAEIRVRAERRLGQMIVAAKNAGQIRRGREWPKDDNCTNKEQLERIKLEDHGIDRKLSARAQKAAKPADEEFEAALARTRERFISDRRKTGLDIGPIHGARSIAPSRQEPDDSLDYFPTPPWATRALIESCVKPLRFHRARLASLSEQSVWEPACGEGHMAEVLKEYFGDVLATDIHHYGYGDEWDFLDGKPIVNKAGIPGEADWIITNPPFGDKTEAFVLRALDLARAGVAMFVRLQWLESIGRYEAIFKDRPPTQICFFAERVNLCKARWDPDGTTATAYIWLMWIKDAAPRPPLWIPPGQREALTHPDDRERFTAHPVIGLNEPSEVTIRRQRNEWPDPMENWPVVRKESTDEPTSETLRSRSSSAGMASSDERPQGDAQPGTEKSASRENTSVPGDRASYPHDIDPDDPLLRIPDFCRREAS